MSREALTLALECIEAWDRGCDRDAYWRDIEEATEAIKAALVTKDVSLPAQEPVAWQWLDTATFRKKIPPTGESECWNPVYKSPPQREWVGLTRNEYHEILGNNWQVSEVIRETEAKLKEKNT